MKALSATVCIAGHRIHLFDLVAGLLAALGYGTWAIYVNYETSSGAALRAGTVQGSYALFSTLLLNTAVRKVSTATGQRLYGKLAALATGLLVITCTPFTLHTLAQTPNILLTVSPGVIWGSIYTIAYLLFLE